MRKTTVTILLLLLVTCATTNPFLVNCQDSDGATGYNFYNADTGELLATSEVSEFMMPFPSDGRYPIVVTAFNECGESDKSEVNTFVWKPATDAPKW